MNIEERFWSKVNVGDLNECWEWQAARNNDNYGTFHTKLKTISSHRFCWELTYGKIPDGLQVLHHCDNPPCCNPRHLFLGTHLDNMQDRNRKGRARNLYGEEHGNSKLTEQEVRQIRIDYSNGNISMKKLGLKYNVTPRTIYMIITRITWKHI